MNVFNENLKLKLKMKLADENITAKELAEKLGMTYPSMAYIINGKSGLSTNCIKILKWMGEEIDTDCNQLNYLEIKKLQKMVERYSMKNIAETIGFTRQYIEKAMHGGKVSEKLLKRIRVILNEIK